MNTNTRLIVCCLLVIIAAAMAGIVIGKQNRQPAPDPTTTAVIESQRTEREAIQATRETRMAELNYMAERDRRADRTQQAIITGMMNRPNNDGTLYFICGATAVFCSVGLLVILWIAYHQAQNRNQTAPAGPPRSASDHCGLCCSLMKMIEDEPTPNGLPEIQALMIIYPRTKTKTV